MKLTITAAIIAFHSATATLSTYPDSDGQLADQVNVNSHQGGLDASDLVQPGNQPGNQPIQSGGDDANQIGPNGIQIKSNDNGYNLAGSHVNQQPVTSQLLDNRFNSIFTRPIDATGNSLIQPGDPVANQGKNPRSLTLIMQTRDQRAVQREFPLGSLLPLDGMDLSAGVTLGNANGVALRSVFCEVFDADGNSFTTGRFTDGRKPSLVFTVPRAPATPVAMHCNDKVALTLIAADGRPVRVFIPTRGRISLHSQDQFLSARIGTNGITCQLEAPPMPRTIVHADALTDVLLGRADGQINQEIIIQYDRPVIGPRLAAWEGNQNFTPIVRGEPKARTLNAAICEMKSVTQATD